jgi:hypothetical protein
MTVAVHTPTLAAKASKVGGRLYRKQVLPVGGLDYTDPTTGAKRRLEFTKDRLDQMVQSFNDGAYDAVKFQLADAKNTHTLDPERSRGTVRAFELTDRGLDMIVEATPEGAKVIDDNPDLPVSARIVEDLTRADGKSFPVAIHHVLGTLDPRVPGMSPWQAVDLSAESVPTVDLSADSFTEKGKQMTDTATNTKPTVWSKIGKALGLTDTATEDEIGDKLAEHLAVTGDEPTADEIAAAVAALEADANKEPVSLTAEAQAAIDLANTKAEQAIERAAKVERDARKKAWDTERDAFLRAGVPAALVDLAAPWCGGDAPTGFIDLANEQTTVEQVRDAAESGFRKLLDECKGLIDLSVIGEAPEPDDAAAAARTEQVKAHRQRAGI